VANRYGCSQRDGAGFVTDTLDHDTRETLFVTDAEVIRRMGVPEKLGYAALRSLDLDRSSGFPQKKKLWGDRRYWPAVKAYLDRTNGLRMGAPTGRDQP
jgi:hypothetical protein